MQGPLIKPAQQDPAIRRPPGPAPIFRSESRVALAESILAEVLAGCTVLAVRGESGVGKTSLMVQLGAEMKSHGLLAVIVGEPPDAPRDVQRRISRAAGLADEDPEPAGLLAALQAERRTARVIVLVDQADKLSTACFRALWRLTRLRDAGKATVQLVLFGALGPWEGLKRVDLERLRKATFSCYVVFPLPADEAAAYLDLRLRTATRSGQIVITRRAAQDLLERARYLPARINELADQAMEQAARTGRRRITTGRFRQTLSASRLSPFFGSTTIRSCRPALVAIAAMVSVAGTVTMLSLTPNLPAFAARPAVLLASIKPAKPVSIPFVSSAAKQPQIAGTRTSTAARHTFDTVPAAARTSGPALSLSAHGRSGLLVVAKQGDTLASLYAKAYLGLPPPPYRDFADANPPKVTAGTVVVLPEPPTGWTQR